MLVAACGTFVLNTMLWCSQTAAGMRAAVAPKLVAAQALSDACSGQPIMHWALFSSLTALLGTAGQGNYAAANAQLNAWADMQQHAGADCCMRIAPFCTHASGVDSSSHPRHVLLVLFFSLVVLQRTRATCMSSKRPDLALLTKNLSHCPWHRYSRQQHHVGPLGDGHGGL